MILLTSNRRRRGGLALALAHEVGSREVLGRPDAEVRPGELAAVVVGEEGRAGVRDDAAAVGPLLDRGLEPAVIRAGLGVVGQVVAFALDGVPLGQECPRSPFGGDFVGDA